MKITDQQLARFNDMVGDFTKKYGLTAEVSTDCVMARPERTSIRFESGYRVKRYELIWAEVKSLTDAGTMIFSDALIFFGKTSSKLNDLTFEIKDVIFNNPATIVLWADGSKTVVKCQGDDVYSEEVGLALCFAKKALGNKSNFNNVFKKWIPEVQSNYAYLGTVDTYMAASIGAKSPAEIIADVKKALNKKFGGGGV